MELVFPVFNIAPLWLFVMMLAASPLVIFTISRFGWKSLADRYELMRPFEGLNLGITSAWINSMSYSRILRIRYSSDGLYLRPVFIFQLFHPAILIPWTEIVSVKVQKMILVRNVVLTIGSPRVADIELSYRTFMKFAKYVESSVEARPKRH